MVEEEIAIALPLLGRSGTLRFSVSLFTQGMLVVQEALAHITVLSDFFDLVGRTLAPLGRLFRLME